MSSVVPAWSTHLPKNSSPRKGLRGFFSLPNFSLREVYCCLRVLRNHLSTNMQRFCLSFSAAGATRTDGISDQYAENSVSEVVDRMKAGAVSDERSPLKEAIDCATASVRVTVEGRARSSYLKKRPPGALARGGNGGGFCHDVCYVWNFVRLINNRRHDNRMRGRWAGDCGCRC